MSGEVFDTMLYEREPPIARIVFNYPQKANALGPATIRDFDACLELARLDHEIRVVIVKANGKGFCAGHEIGETKMPAMLHDEEVMGIHHHAQSELFLRPVLNLWEFPKPMIAQVHGYAIGAGTYYALLPDLTIASRDAYFQMPLVQSIGLPGGETMIEPWLFMNVKRAAEYLYTAQTLSADEALAAGLVNRVVDRESLEATVEELASEIARAPLSTLMATKTLLRRAWESMGMRMHLEMSNDWVALIAAASDSQAFRERMGGRRTLPRKALADRSNDKPSPPAVEPTENDS